MILRSLHGPLVPLASWLLSWFFYVIILALVALVSAAAALRFAHRFNAEELDDIEDR